MAAQIIRIEAPVEVHDNTGPGLSSAQRRLSAFDRAAQKTREQLEKLTGDKFEVVLSAVDKVSSSVKKAGSALKELAGKAWGVTMKAVDLATAPIKGVLNLLADPVLQFGALIGVEISAEDTLNTYTAFEKSISKVKSLLETTSGDIAGDMTLLSDKAREMGRNTSVSASEAADAMGVLAQAGWGTEDILSAIEPVIRFSEAAGLELAQACDLAVESMDGLGLGAGGLAGFLDQVALTAASSGTDMEALIEAFQTCGGTVLGLNMPLSEAALLLGALADCGVEGAEAGGALHAMLESLSDAGGQSAGIMKALGISAFDCQGKFRGYAAVLQDLNQKTSGLTDQQKDYCLSALGMGMQAEDLEKFLSGAAGAYGALASGARDADGALQRMSETMNDNIEGDLAALDGALDDIKISFMERLQPHLRAFVQWFTSKMPDVQTVVEQVADVIHEKLSWLQNTITEVTHSDEWASADLWGKLAIAWNKVVAEPFGTWWESTGRQWLTGVASDIGRGLGGAITAGLVGLLGLDLDVAGAAADGARLGTSFLSGFQKGFNMEKITAALKDWMENHKAIVVGLGLLVGGMLLGGLVRGLAAAKSLIGGKAGGAAGGLSAVTAPIMRVSAGVVHVYGGVVNSTRRTARNLVGQGARVVPNTSTVLRNGAVVAGTGGAVTRGLATVGTTLGSHATTIGGAALAGGAGILGGVAGGVTLISAGVDLHRSLTSEDEKEKEAYGNSAGWKAGGVITGAAIGTAILPGLGTLIGAGIGGIAGWIVGDSEIKRYEEELKLAEEAAKQLLIEQEQARYSSQALKAAVQDLADGYITAEEFAAMKQAEITAGIERRFGNIKLSMSEIQSMAKGIVFAHMEKGMSAFTEASAKAANELAQLHGTANSLERLNWKAGLGLASANPEEYRQGVDAFLAEAKQYVESRQFEITAATGLLLGDQVDLTELNGVFATIQSEIDALGAQLTAKFEVEGELDTAGIADLQNQIMEKTRMLSDAEYEGRLDLLKITFGGDQLSRGSFETLQNELEKTALEAKEGIQSAYAAAFSGLELELKTSSIDKSAYEERFSKLEEAYKSEMAGVDQRISDFLADEIGEAFGLSAGELTSGMQESMKQGVSPADWTAQQAGAFLGLDDLEDNAGAQLAAMVNRLAQGLPDLWGTAEQKVDFIGWNEISTRNYVEFLRTNGGIDLFLGRGFQPTGNDADSQALQGGPRRNQEPPYAWAWGGIMTKPHIGLVAEAGPESIIPLSPSKRERGLELWEETGALLGVTPYVEGAITGRTAAEPVPVATGSAAAPVVQVTIPGLPQITVNMEGQDSPERITAVVKERLLGMVDDIGGALAEQLAPVFANMPVRGGA